MFCLVGERRDIRNSRVDIRTYNENDVWDFVVGGRRNYWKLSNWYSWSSERKLTLVEREEHVQNSAQPLDGLHGAGVEAPPQLVQKHAAENDTCHSLTLHFSGLAEIARHEELLEDS